jgi:hypothetical protein
VLRSYAVWNGLRWSGPSLIGLIWVLRRRIWAKPRPGALRFLSGLFKWWLTATICRLPDRASHYQSFRDQAFQRWENLLLDSIYKDRLSVTESERPSAKDLPGTPHND